MNTGVAGGSPKAHSRDRNGERWGAFRGGSGEGGGRGEPLDRAALEQRPEERVLGMEAARAQALGSGGAGQPRRLRGRGGAEGGEAAGSLGGTWA